MKGLLALGVLVLSAQTPSQDRDAAEEVGARYVAFNDAWERCDMSFIRDYFAHDDDMLLFFERRQLRDWRDVEALYENVFAHARPGSVTSTYSNLKVEARGSMAYVAANFDLRATSPRRRERDGHRQGHGGVREARRNLAGGPPAHLVPGAPGAPAESAFGDRPRSSLEPRARRCVAIGGGCLPSSHGILPDQRWGSRRSSRRSLSHRW